MSVLFSAFAAVFLLFINSIKLPRPALLLLLVMMTATMFLLDSSRISQLSPPTLPSSSPSSSSSFLLGKRKGETIFASALPSSLIGIQSQRKSGNNVPSSLASSSSSTITNSLSSDIIAQYQLPGPEQMSYFTHMAYDRKRSILYAGATNRVIQLNESNFKILSEAETGPVEDSPQCYAKKCTQEIETVQTNNHNKILIVNYIGDTLIACGSIRQGACRIYDLSKFPTSSEFIGLPLAANDENSTTFAFIGPSQYESRIKNDILYVGTTFTNIGEYRHDVPAISSRQLDNLSYAEYSIQQSIINIDVKYRDNFLVDYVYGFNSSEYAYFMIVQKQAHLAEEAGYVTRLARICITDHNYDSYTEITIQCLGKSSGGTSGGLNSNNGGGGSGTTTTATTAGGGDIDYNILRDAKITVAGQKLGQQLGIKKDDYVLVTAFSPSKEITNQPQDKSALCVYSLKGIEEVFIENIHMCFNGTIKDRNLGYISGTINDGKCPAAGSQGNIYDFCTVGLKISGVSPIVARALFNFGNESITSVVATTTGPHSLAFLGTENGKIKKVLLSGHNPGEYEEIIVDPGRKILPDTMMSMKKNYLYVLSRKSISKLRVEHCSIYTNCSSCLDSRDPFCGWCSLEKKCTIRSACQKDTSATRWLSLSSGQQCIDFESIIPDKIPISTERTQVQLIIRTLPEPMNAKYRCVFGNSTPIDAEIIENGLSCMTPPINQRPIIDLNQDHVLVPLSVRSSETNKDFVSRSFAFFDCTRHNTCRKCVKSQFGCNWCIFENKCVYKMEQCQSTESVISTEDICPHIKHQTVPILLPTNVPKEIRLEIENLPKPKTAHAGFLCKVIIEGAHMLLPARVDSNKYVVCEKTPYSYEANTSEFVAKLHIMWNRQHYIDTAAIILYKCDVLGSHREHPDCSLCVTRDPKYQCSWCGNLCVYNETCTTSIVAGAGTGISSGTSGSGTTTIISALTSSSSTSSSVAASSTSLSSSSLDRINECPRPRIDLISPLSGPLEGGTLVTIEGSNLGIREEDVRGKISIGNVPCDLVNYEISVKIECYTGRVTHELTAPVKVSNNAGYEESVVQFQYKDIKLEGLLPTMGPQSGGTQLTIIGKYLNIGSSIRAFLDDYECSSNMTQSSSTRLTCITSAARQPEPIKALRLLVDGAVRHYTCLDQQQQQQHQQYYDDTMDAAHQYHHQQQQQQLQLQQKLNNNRKIMNVNYPFSSTSTRSSLSSINCSIFNYTQDPKIMQIKPLRSFTTGGRMLTVHGTNFDSIQKPEIEVFYEDDRINKSSCFVINANQMECPSPPVNMKFHLYKKSIEQLQQAAALTSSSSSGMNNNNHYFLPQQQRLKSYIDYSSSSTNNNNNNDDDDDDFEDEDIIEKRSLYENNLFTTSDYHHLTSSASEYTPTITNNNNNNGFINGNGHQLPSSSGSSSSQQSSSSITATTLKIRETQLTLQIGFLMDNVKSVHDLSKNIHVRSTIIYVDDPIYYPFPNNGIKLYKGDTLVIEGENLNIASDETDVNVTIGLEQCNVTSLALTQLVCSPPEQQPLSTDENGILTNTELPLVIVRVGKYLRFHIGYLKYDLLKPYAFSHAVVGIGISITIIVILLIIILIIYRRKSTQAEREYKRIQIQMDTLESNVRLECKQAFAELQTDMTDLTADLESTGIPTLDHINYIMKVFFPGVSDHPVLNSPKLRHNTPRTNYDTAMIQFEQLISNKYFVLAFIETLEGQKSFNIRDKVNVASLLMIVLMNKMEYATEILKCLLLRLIDKSVMTKHPQLMLRRTESVVEKMLTNYMAICMYDYLKEYAGSSLFLLFKAIKHQIEKGLVDAITNDARYSLSEDKLLREQIECNLVTLHIVQDDLDEKIQCKVLDYDTISQVKSKILDSLFKNTPFSMRPSVNEVDLEWRHGRGGHLTLQDEDLTTKTINGWKRLNTLAHYGVKESAVMSLIARQNDSYNINYNSSSKQQPFHNFYYINNSQSHIIINGDLESGLQQPRVYHLIKPIIADHHMNMKNSALSAANAAAERTHKAIPEIFLTRLLATKGTVQKFVDDFFATILTVNEELPPAVKWLFDLLDEAARRHGILDQEIVHAWKSNSLPLRFWVNFIKNPDFIFDINKTPTVDACLSVIAQTFMDACSTTEHRLGKDSPSNKLLFAKDIPLYRDMVKQFYREVARLPQISDQEMGTAMQQLSVQQSDEFDTIAALKELYIYVTKYRDQIMHTLEVDINCKKMHLAHKLENVACTLDGEETSAC